MGIRRHTPNLANTQELLHNSLKAHTEAVLAHSEAEKLHAAAHARLDYLEGHWLVRLGVFLRLIRSK